MENIIKKIKKLKDIRPDTEYSQRSKLVILATPIASKINPAFKAIFDVIEILKKLKQIKPDAEYSRISKLAVLNSPLLPQKRSIFNWQLAFTMAGLGLVLISGVLINNSRPTAPNLNAQALETEFKNLDINIQLAKIEYSQNIDEAVSLALKEITEKQTNHLNPIILESEQNELNSESLNNKEIDGLLNQILL
ncbi:MAG: hypothetical protein AAB404_02390 [Patescibacteria group bacterium]